MPSKNSFVASLFVFALFGFLLGGMNVYENVEVWRYGQTASMSLSDPRQKLPQFADDFNTTERDVVYTSSAGEVVVPQKMVLKTVAAQLDAGQSVSITYMTNNPKKMFYRNEGPESPWVWLIVGFVALATAIYALRLRKREAGE